MYGQRIVNVVITTFILSEAPFEVPIEQSFVPLTTRFIPNIYGHYCYFVLQRPYLSMANGGRIEDSIVICCV